jgi:hypothetical protein
LFSSSNEEEEKSIELKPASPILPDTDEGTENKSPHNNNNDGDGIKFDIDKLMNNLNKKQRRTLLREYERQGNSCCLHKNLLRFCSKQINIAQNFISNKSFLF